jgi:ferric-dicitrate binding protein FerR (iron transport regulator)
MDSGNTYENIDQLLTRFFDGDVSNDEIFIIEKWKTESAENLKVFNDYLKIWETSAKARNVKTVDIENAWHRFENAVRDKDVTPGKQPKLIHLFTGSFARIAAVALILIGLASVIYFFVLDNGINQVYTASSQTQLIELADGSMVNLNALTQFTYPDQFNGETRQVELNGEAYFDIARNENQPFIIKANGTYIKVLGTSFNVKAKDLSEKVEIVVNSGKVAFGEEGSEHPILLEAGDKGTYSKTDQLLTKSTVNDPNIFAWRTKKLIFNNAKLDYVVQVLNEVYFSDIKITDARLSECTLTASFDHDSLEDVLSVIKLAMDVSITKTGNEILLSGKGCED